MSSRRIDNRELVSELLDAITALYKFYKWTTVSELEDVVGSELDINAYKAEAAIFECIRKVVGMPSKLEDLGDSMHRFWLILLARHAFGLIDKEEVINTLINWEEARHPYADYHESE